MIKTLLAVLAVVTAQQAWPTHAENTNLLNGQRWVITHDIVGYMRGGYIRYTG